MKVIPAKEVVILKDPGKQTTASGLELPPDKDRPEVGIVIAIGKGDKPVDFKVGDEIIYSRYMENNVNVHGEVFNLIHFKNILGVVSNTK